jgi:hypothetical protein
MLTPMTETLSNGGPPLDDDDAAKKQAFDAPFDIAAMRARRAAMIGLTYDEYVLEILERGRYLNAADTDRIAQIIARRGVRY